MEKVLIFGTGCHAEKILERIEEAYEIIGFLDNQVKKQNTYFDEEQKYYITSPEEIKGMQFDKVVIASTNYASEMFSQLLSLGVREHNIIVDFVSTVNKVFIFDFLKMQLNRYYEENRLDIAVKYLAVENYYGKNDFGWTLYKEMQKKRLNLDDMEAEIVLNKFKELIKSFEENGFLENSYIFCDEKLRIMDGAHRVALCLYFNIPFVQVRIVPKEFDCNFGKEWFWETGFELDEIKRICRQYEDFFKEDRDCITAILWPPVYDFFEEITNELSELVEIKEIVDMEYRSFSQFQEIVRAVYSVDTIASWKIETKLEYMKNYELKLRIIKYKLRKPLYRINGTTYLPLSFEGERIKRIIRTRFKKKINPYFYDIVIHIADNYYQSGIIDKVFTLDLDISSYFGQIKVNPIHKETDVACNFEEFEIIKEKIVESAKEYAERNGLSLRIILEYEGRDCQIILEYLNHMIYQFNVSTEIKNFEEES